MSLRRSIYCLFTCIAFLISITEIQAQQTAPITNAENDSFLLAKKNKWIVPVTISIAYPTLVYVCYKKWDTGIQDESQEGRTAFKTFISKSVTNLGLGKYQAIGLAGTSIFAFASRNEKLKRTVITWAGGLAINSILTDQLKKTFQRHRPNTGDPYNSFDWRDGSAFHKSFPSAHTSNAFTTATVFATIYRDKKWVAPVAFSLATLVGLSRIYDNAHWGSDVLTGAAVGFLSAKAMNALYKTVRKKILFLPQAGINYYSLNMIYQF